MEKIFLFPNSYCFFRKATGIRMTEVAVDFKSGAGLGFLDAQGII